MSIPIYEEAMLTLLRVIHDRGIYSKKGCEPELSRIFKLTEKELNVVTEP